MLIALFVVLAVQTAQTAPTTMNERGAHVMGFDQEKTVHHFLLFNDGGAIEVAVKDPSDTGNRNAIRSHLPHIAMMFRQGDFDAPMLVHDRKDVPGVQTLAARKNTIVYRYVETPSGGRVDFVTTDPDALNALHDFLRYQITQHKTGDSGQVVTRK